MNTTNNNSCIGLSQHLENFELINLNSTEVYKFATNNNAKQQQQTNKISIFKFKLQTDVIYCKYCDQFHLNKTNSTDFNHTINKNNNLTENLFSLNDLLQVANLSRFSLLNNNNKINNNDIFFNLKNRRLILKKKIDSVLISLNYFNDSIRNNETRIHNYFDQIRKQISFYHQHKLDQLNEFKQKLFKDLDDYNQKCVRSIDFESNEWLDFKQFYLNHQINANIIDFFLDSSIDLEQSSTQIEQIKNFELKLKEKKKQFNDYIQMYHKIKFEPIFNSNSNQIGMLNLTDLNNEKSIKLPDIEQFNRLNDQLFSIKLATEWNSINYDGDNAAQTFKQQSLLTIHSIDNNVLLCNRYARSNELGQVCCDLSLIDQFGNLIKEKTFKNSLVRCLTTNSKHILFTIESDNDESLLKQFDLVLYDAFSLTQLKSIQINSLRPIALNMDDEKCYLVIDSNNQIIPMINVFDFNLNLISSFGQSINESMEYYFPISIDGFVIKNDKCFIQQRLVDTHQTLMSIIDLKSGFYIFKKLKIPFKFNNFYVISFDLLLFVDENNLICYDLNMNKIKSKTELKSSISNSTSSIISYCLNSMGFIICLFKNLNLITVF